MSIAPGVNTAGIDIEGAKDAYYKLWQIADSAYANPDQDWSSEIRAVAMPPVANEILNGIRSMSASGIKNVGHSSIAISVVAATPSTINFEACVNTFGVDTIDKAGHSVRSGDGAGSHWRYVQTATFARNHDAWLAAAAIGHMDQTC